MLTKHQERQNASINTEFGKRHIYPQCEFFSNTSCPEGIRTIICISTDYPDWRNIIQGAQSDIRRFDIRKSADYIIKMLHNVDIYGVAIRGPRDDHDREFGEFVAKARLLKHIKKERATDD